LRYAKSEIGVTTAINLGKICKYVRATDLCDLVNKDEWTTWCSG